jgi:hypothetical protein
VKDTGDNPFGGPTYGSAGDTSTTPSEDTDEPTTGITGDESTGSDDPGVCGNGVLEDGEACDGEDLAGASCDGYGFDDGILVCSADCRILTDGCHTCGDGQRSLIEACDGDDFGGETCQSLGYGGGTLGCAADCTSLVTTDCTPLASCGDGVRNATEQCDGADLGGQSCTGLGFDQGTLGCNAGSCTFNTTGCSYLDCTKEGDFCIFDEDDPQSSCCPPGVGGNTFGLCVVAVCQ